MTDPKINLNVGTTSGGIAIGHGAQATGAGGSINTNAAQNLGELIAAIRRELPALPQDQRAGVEFLVTQVESEAKAAQPSKSKLTTLLTSVKTICEGVIGRLITGYLGGA